MATVARENIGLLNDKIIVKVSKEDYFPIFEKKLKEYSKTVNMPGFRKGMVPAGMIKKMYGPSIYTDEILKTVEKQLYVYLDTEKPDMFGQPIALNADIRKLDFNNPADYEFGFEIGLKPDFQIAPLDKAPVTFNKVKVTDEMVQEEVERMQIKGSTLTQADVIDNEENVLNILFTESDTDGNPIEGGVEKENSVILKYLTPAIQDKLKGKVKDAFIVTQLSKALEDDKLKKMLTDFGFEKTDTEAADKYFKLTLTKIEITEKREMTEEFFNEVFPGAAIATETEFRQKFKEELEQYWDGQSRNQLHDQLYHYMLDKTNMEFPAEFLKRWLQTGSQDKKTAEEAEAEFPVFSKQLKWTLISDKIIKENDLQVSQEELKESMRIEIMQYFGNMNIGQDSSFLDSYIDRMMKDKKQVDESYHRLVTDKLFKWAQTQANATENEISAENLMAMQHNHHH